MIVLSFAEYDLRATLLDVLPSIVLILPSAPMLSTTPTCDFPAFLKIIKSPALTFPLITLDLFVIPAVCKKQPFEFAQFINPLTEDEPKPLGSDFPAFLNASLTTYVEKSAHQAWLFPPVNNLYEPFRSLYPRYFFAVETIPDPRFEAHLFTLLNVDLILLPQFEKRFEAHLFTLLYAELIPFFQPENIFEKLKLNFGVAYEYVGYVNLVAEYEYFGARVNNDAVLHTGVANGFAYANDVGAVLESKFVNMFQ